VSAVKPVLQTPLYGVAERLGGRFVEAGGGWLIADAYAEAASEEAAARHHLAIADVSADGSLRIEGAEAEATLRAAYDVPVLAIGESAPSGNGWCYRLRADLFTVITAPGDQVSTLDAIESAARAAGHRITVTDLTHGQASVRIIGPRVAELMSKLCGLDFSPAAFPEGTAKRSSFAKTAQLVVRRDMGGLPAFTMVGARSVAAYVWETISEAGEEYGITPIGQDALSKIATGSTERGT